MKMTSRLLVVFLFAVSISAQAQVGINSTAANPDNSAMLDVSSANKGLLIPRIALTGTNDVTTVVSPVASLLVYNTATVSDVTPGFYYYNGTAWKRLGPGIEAETDPVFTGAVDMSGSLTGDLLKYDGTKYVKFTPNFTESNYSFNTRYGVKLLARNDAQANVNFVLSPKGNGSILARQPDGTSAGGMNRGQYAVDLQISRMSSAMVSSGDGSVVGGGENNTANGTASVVPGGSTNTANGNYSTASGIGNNSSGLASTAFGQGNTALGFYSFAAGKDNSASGIGSTAAGQGNTALGNNTFATGIGSIAFSDGEVAVGNYPTTYSVANNITDRVFVVGNGTGTGSRSNAFVIQKNANTTIGGLLTINGNGTGTSLTLPPTRGATGQVLTTDGSGGTSWVAPAGGTVTGVTGTVPIVSSGGNTPDISISAATTSAAGSMSAADKTKLDGLQAGWNLTGNSGTTPGTNFIGTTDNKALVFKVDNVKSGEINTNYSNASFGYMTLNSISTGFSNSANGNQALYSNTTGYQNTAVGYSALYFNTTGYGNTAVGVLAGRYIADLTTENSTSSNSVYLGPLTKAGANGNSNEIVIGYNATGAGSNTVTLGNTAITKTVLQGNVLHYGTTAGYVGIQAPAAPTSYSLTLPTAAPASNGQVLSSTTAGVMSWATPASGTVTAVSGTAPIVSSGGNTPAISISAATTSAAGSMSAADKTKLDAISGTNTGDQTITLTGDVTGSGTGTFPSTIATSSVSNTKLANMAANSIKVNGTAAAAAPADLTIPASTFPSRKSTGNITANVITDFAFDILNDPNAATVRTTIGAGTGNGTVTEVTGSAPIVVTTGTTTPTISISPATTSTPGAMSAADKTKLNAQTTGTAPGQMQYWNGSAWVTMAPGVTGQVLTFTGGVPTWRNDVITYQIGDFAQGGIVFWVDETGQHGLVCAKVDQNTSARWNAGSNTNTMAKADGPLSGEKNTVIIIASQGYGDGTTYAARICNELQITENGKTYGDWYLPSLNELTLMYENRDVINTTATANGGSNFADWMYWSSTESSISTAWLKWFNNGGNQDAHGKQYSGFNVRAVRAF